jgi:hypothetical protein
MKETKSANNKNGASAPKMLGGVGMGAMVKELK